MKLRDEFLKLHAESWEWPETEPKAILRRVCEEYNFGPGQKGYDFMRVSHGWFWGKLGDEMEATLQSVFFRKELDEMYAIVAKENGWDYE